MSLVHMQKIRLLTHAAAAADVLRVVQKEGVVEFTEIEDSPLRQQEPTEFEFNYVSSRLDFAVGFLSDYAPERSGLAVALEGTEERVSDERIAKIVDGVYSADIIDAAQHIQKELNEGKSKLRALKKERAVLDLWKDVKFIVGKNYDTETTKTFFVTQAKTTQKQKNADVKEHASLMDVLGEEKILSHVVSVDAMRAIVTFVTKKQEDVDTLLKAHGYEIVVMEQRRGTPTAELERINRSLMRTEEKIENLEKQARKLAGEHLADLKILSDHTLWQKDRHQVFTQAYRTEHVLVYEAWCVAHQYDQLQKALAEVSELCVMEKIQPAEGEIPPVEIKNANLVRPFESVTRLYGLPGHTDLDPTPYLSGFFFVFFGFCLTDVGYGAILAAVTGYLLWRYDVAKGTKIMLELLFLGGVASFVAGLFFGGYFGLDMTRMPEFLQAIQLFDPIANPMPVFYLALALGVVHVMTGLLLAIWHGKKLGSAKDAALDNGPWLLLFLSLIVWGATQADVLALPGAVYLVYGSLLAIVLTQGRKEKNIALKAVKGIMSLYDSVSYFADILSYSRLLALGLATSALAFAVNLIAGMAAGDDGSIFGMIAAVLILVVGHLFNLAINAFGAFIHSARLQFVEFFAKFITGTGRIFVPFKRKERNVVIRN